MKIILDQHQLGELKAFYQRVHEAAEEVGREARRQEPHIKRIAAEALELASTIDFGRLAQLREDVANVVKEIPEDVRRALDHCSSQAWFLPHDVLVNETYTICLSLDRGDTKAIEDRLIFVARERIASVKARLALSFPSRKDLLLEALEAHEEGRYALAIPAMLAQSDGMFHEIFGASLFQRGGTKAALEAVDRHLGPVDRKNFSFNIWVLLFRQLSSPSALGKPFNPPFPDHLPLNRHAVLHGLDINYPTEANSLRVVMLVELLSDTKTVLNLEDEAESHEV